MASSAQLSKKPKLSVQVDDLSLHPQLIQKLKEAKLCSFKSILHLSHPELQKAAKVSSSEAKIILGVVSEALLENKVVSVLSMLCEKTFPTKLKLTSNLLKDSSENCNSIYTGTITEICGESGSGKTQLCLHLSMLAQLPNSAGGLNSKVIYIHSEGEFPIKRFLQMAEAFKKIHPKLQNLKLSDNLMLKKVFNLKQLIYVLQKGLPKVLQEANKPKMIVIDSVAALLRCEYDSLSERTSAMLQLATEIWKLANCYGMSVICVNQVSGSNKSNQVKGITNMDVPSLGLLWSNTLTTRIKVSRKPLDSTVPATRVLELIYSSYHPHICKNFKISESGIEVL